MAPKAMKLMKAMKAKGGAKGGAKGCAKGKDKDKHTGIKVSDMDKNSGALRGKGSGKGKDKGQPKGIFVNTPSGQKIAIVVHEFDTIANVKASLPTVVNANEFDIMRSANDWDTISTAKISAGENVYAVKHGGDARDLFSFTNAEVLNGGIANKMKILQP
jgi:hypothetical protein